MEQLKNLNNVKISDINKKLLETIKVDYKSFNKKDNNIKKVVNTFLASVKVNNIDSNPNIVTNANDINIIASLLYGYNNITKKHTLSNTQLKKNINTAILSSFNLKTQKTKLIDNKYNYTVDLTLSNKCYQFFKNVNLLCYYALNNIQYNNQTKSTTINK